LKIDAASFLKQLFFDGFAHHLWFLTFLLLVEVGITTLAIIRPSQWVSMPVAALSLFLLSILPTSTYPTFGSYLMVMSWWSLPSVFLIVLCKPVIRYILVRKRYFLSYANVFFFIGILTTWASTFGVRNSAIEAASGVFLFVGFLLLGLSSKISLSSALRSLVGLSAGIYLIHVFYVEAFHHIAVAIGLPLHSYVGVISIFSLSMLASIISVVVLKKTGPSWVFNGVSLGIEKRN
jgi:hypothetical protein